MTKVSVILMVFFVVLFCYTQVTLDYFFPHARTNFDEWMKFFIVKDAIYDFMFFMMSLVVFWNVKGLTKSVMCFAVFMTGGSFIDKVIFNLNQYLLSDILLILMALFFSLKNYVSWRKKISKRGV